ncbi:MAG: RHS repeat-associated core domain-containing protein [Clostridia bacterium]|nr:RHS repeat-associated core domain-containing protein [Clostridia bacterium]
MFYIQESPSRRALGQNKPFTDSDLGLYYLQSRYYDPNTCRFINADIPDVITATPTALTDKNLFVYCDNNPVMRTDHDGMFWGTLFDVASLGMSILEVWANPYDPWAWAGLVGDAIDLLPIVSGVGEATDILRIATKADDFIDLADDIHDTANVVDSTIDTYKNLRKVNKGNGLEVHHIIEKRFAPFLGQNKSEMLSIALSHDDHLVFTKAWREAIPYKTAFDTDQIWNSAQRIYANYPELLAAARKTLGR